jgi:SAM-dependent methyltransferase
MSPNDVETASAFAESWNRISSVYTRAQFLDWFAPLDPADFAGRDVLELGFGNGSLLVHFAQFRPARLAGVELGDTLEQARAVLQGVPVERLELHRGDLTQVDLGHFDLVYCIGVLHHLASPEGGFAAVLRHTRPGGAFHCWVYAREGNGVVVWLVDPIRRVASRLPWWLTRYALALPLVIPFFLYSKLLRAVSRLWPASERLIRALPLGSYSLWIAERELAFFRHVAFDQLVTPRTIYFSRDQVESWLGNPEIEPGTTYLVFRNGNSWKLGGRRRPSATRSDPEPTTSTSQ